MMEAILNYSRACAICGTLPWRDEGRIFCAFCGEYLVSHARLQDRDGAYSLWRWHERGSAVGELVRQLKGGGDKKVAAYFVTLFLEKWYVARGSLHEKPVFVPAPPREKNVKDHAYYLAEAFARQTGGEIFCGLERLQKSEQKMRNETERKTQRLKLTTAFNADGKSVIFVDDVIVTGNTIAAAYEALGQPAKFAAWCLADRVRLC